MTRLKGLAEDADLCRVCLDNRLTDRVIDGVKSQASHLELLRQRDLPDAPGRDQPLQVLRGRRLGRQSGPWDGIEGRLSRWSKGPPISSVSGTRRRREHRRALGALLVDQLGS